MLRISRLALFFAFFSLGRMLLLCAGGPAGEVRRTVRRYDLDFRRIQASLHNHTMRRGGLIDRNRGDRFTR